MIKFFKILLVVICINVLQFCFEIVVMSVLEKIGLSYMDTNSGGESFIELIIATAGFYYYSRLILMTIDIPITIGLILYFSRNREISFKSIAIVHVAVNLTVFLVLWLAFGNALTMIANPLLGLLIAGLLIYLFASKFRNPLIRRKITTV